MLIRNEPYSAFLFQVQSSLAANILSSLSALVGFVLLSVNLATLSPALWMCYLNHENVPSEHHGFNYYDSITDDSSRSCPITISLLAVSIFRWDVLIL